MIDMNLELNQNAIYKNVPCTKCGRRYPDTVLNIEGYIHHSKPIMCIDTKSCERTVRKNKRRKK